nr:hypothetical protein [Tanacetum cinerariifolium]
YVPGPEHADDEIVAEDQPYAEDASPITLLPEYVPESDFKAHPEDDDDKDPEEILLIILPMEEMTAMTRRNEAASTSYSPPLQLPSASRREDRPEVTLPPWK